MIYLEPIKFSDFKIEYIIGNGAFSIIYFSKKKK